MASVSLHKQDGRGKASNNWWKETLQSSTIFFPVGKSFRNVHCEHQNWTTASVLHHAEQNCSDFVLRFFGLFILGKFAIFNTKENKLWFYFLPWVHVPKLQCIYKHVHAPFPLGDFAKYTEKPECGFRILRAPLHKMQVANYILCHFRPSTSCYC